MIGMWLGLRSKGGVNWTTPYLWTLVSWPSPQGEGNSFLDISSFFFLIINFPPFDSNFLEILFEWWEKL